MISSRKSAPTKTTIQLAGLTLQQREKFLRELSSLKKKYGIKD